MKAIVFAAGFGTRLLPYTRFRPKPLFPINGRPLIDIIITNLIDAGCSEVLINSHHLHEQIDAFISEQPYAVPVTTRYEPEILGTGGAIKNAVDLWDDQPFMAVNSDIVTDIPFSAVYDFHLQHPEPATLVLFDAPEFNTVIVDKNGFITAIEAGETETSPETKQLTFTGIQVLNPEILNWIPADSYVNSIDVYRQMLSEGLKIKAYIAKKHYWNDIGTPERYTSVVFENMAPKAFSHAFANRPTGRITRTLLAGDGSDRLWYRLTCDGHCLIMADHGIRRGQQVAEFDSFIAIGRHLLNHGIPVPKIFAEDAFAGLVLLEDLGDTHLQDFVRQSHHNEAVLSIYRTIIDLLIRMSLDCSAGFEPAWAHQTPLYSREMILENECRYFVSAFLNQFAGMGVRYEALEKEFILLAEKTVEFGIQGFMHRDFQSRNIMIKDNRPYLIDFQGGRIGPIQYDLASLLIDPYVALSESIQERLCHYCADQIVASVPVNRENFMHGYRLCSITRNLQMLGAFGYLSRVKGKQKFEQYIPAAVRSLKQNFAKLSKNGFPILDSILKNL